MNRTKIICTIGPSSDNKETLRQLIKNGLSVARLNLSHGNQEYYKKIIHIIKELREELNVPVAILMDTRGPEIRTKTFKEGQIKLAAGDKVSLCNGDFEGDKTRFCITYDRLYKDVQKGSAILIDDGLIELEVLEIIDTEILSVVKNGGIVKNRKGINVPRVSINLPAITEKDKEDIIFGIQNDIDFIAASFIRKSKDVNVIRELLNKNGGKNIHIISKIENQEGVDNINDIIAVSDAIMVARGDLGVEIPPERIPLTQKSIIEKCNSSGIPVITATQMLDSMINNPRPTRAEVSDVANAVLDGTDAIMLSGETAAGAYPIEAVKVMKKTAIAIEDSIDYKNLFKITSKLKETTITNAVSYSACTTAMQLNAKAIICPTVSGRTARLISIFRPDVSIIATTANPKTQRQMQLLWGVFPLITKEETSSDLLFYKSVELAKAIKFVKKQDLVVLTAGIPLSVPGSTNLMKVIEVD